MQLAGETMLYLQQQLPRSLVDQLIREVLDAYSPSHNALDLELNGAVKELKLIAEGVIQENLRYLSAFLFLVTDTTFETSVSGHGNGWHIDGTTKYVSGDCYNIWIPIYTSSNETGLEVITHADNLEIYEQLGNPLLTANVITKVKSKQLFNKLTRREDSDLLIIGNDTNILEISSKDLSIHSILSPSVGDLAIFKQNELHRGRHSNGVRIQLSIKFVTNHSVVDNAYYVKTAPKMLSKHGRLESHLIKELLGFRLNSCTQL